MFWHTFSNFTTQKNVKNTQKKRKNKLEQNYQKYFI